MNNQSQIQNQKQIQKLSHLQIQALNFLKMSTDDLKAEIAKALEENPALELVSKNRKKDLNLPKGNEISSEKYQQALESAEDRGETLQSHLMHQLNAISLSYDEYELSQKLIYNLDKNGFYGSMIAPESLLNKNRPLQNKQLLEKCLNRLQQMDPVGTCCKSPEESLLIQAKADKQSPVLAIFLLEGHLELLNPPEAEKVYHKIKKFQTEWHNKAFATPLIIDKKNFSVDDVQKAIEYILHLNPHPAQGYTKDISETFEQPDIVLNVERIPGALPEDDFDTGLVAGDDECHFQVKYASGALPDLRIASDFSFDKEDVIKAQELIESLVFRESTIALQGCQIVKEQLDFFLKGPGHIKVLYRKDVAQKLGIHESTVSRMSEKKGNKYIQTQWGAFPVCYFFSSGVASEDGGVKVSAEAVKQQIQEILAASPDENLSDSKLTQLLQEKGIKIARRTVAKYRNAIGIKNSYSR